MQSSDKQTSVVYYHGACADGFGAAFAAWLKLGDAAEYVPSLYEADNSLAVEGRDVYVLDFSFESDVMEDIGRKARSLTVLDHHATACEKLAHFKPLCCGKIHFDLGHSGAALAWHHFHPGTPLPFMFQCIESRDLWRWDVPKAKEYLAWLDAQPMEFKAWKKVFEATPAEEARFIDFGWAMTHKTDALVKSIAAAAVPVCIAGVDGLGVNASMELRSEVGELLAARSGTFGLVWRVLSDKKVKCSLRGIQPYDVRTIAEKFGGGGHQSAASFELPTERLVDLVRGSVEVAPAASIV